MAGLDDPARVALPQPHESVAAGAIDAGKAQDVDRRPARPARLDPARLVREPRETPVRTRQRRARLVDPLAAVVPINPDGRIIEDAAERRRSRDRRGEELGRRAAPCPGRDRDDDRLRPLNRLFERRLPSRAVEDISLDPGGSKRSDALVRPRRAARLYSRRPPDERLGAISDPEEEDFHVRIVICRRPEGKSLSQGLNANPCRKRARTARYYISHSRSVMAGLVPAIHAMRQGEDGQMRSCWVLWRQYCEAVSFVAVEPRGWPGQARPDAKTASLCHTRQFC